MNVLRHCFMQIIQVSTAPKLTCAKTNSFSHSPSACIRYKESRTNFADAEQFGMEYGSKASWSGLLLFLRNQNAKIRGSRRQYVLFRFRTRWRLCFYEIFIISFCVPRLIHFVFFFSCQSEWVSDRRECALKFLFAIAIISSRQHSFKHSSGTH